MGFTQQFYCDVTIAIRVIAAIQIHGFEDFSGNVLSHAAF
jgi:hypothetical protein